MLTKKTDYEFWIEAAFFALAGVGVVVLLFMFGLEKAIDIPHHWKYCAYTLRGIDPYPCAAAGIIPEQAQDLGRLSTEYTATPWGLLLGSMYYFGFADIKLAIAYFYALCPVMLLITCACLYWKAGKICNDKKFAVLVLLMALSSPDFFISVASANASGIISCLLLMAWALRDDHPVVVGILLGFAMTKPQQAALICLAFLLQKRFMSLIVGALLDIVAWLWVSIHTGTGMFELLAEFLKSTDMFIYVNQGILYYGIFTSLFTDPSTALMFSMSAGIIFVVFFWYFYGKHKEAPEVFNLCWAYMASTFWSHSTMNCYVLALPSAVCLYIMRRSEKLKSRIFWFVCCCYINFNEIFRSRKVFRVITGHMPTDDIRHAIYTAFYVGLIAVGVMLYFALTRESRKKILPDESA